VKRRLKKKRSIDEEGREDAINADKESMKTRIQSLITRLEDARYANIYQEEGYNADVKAQKDLENC